MEEAHIELIQTRFLIADREEAELKYQAIVAYCKKSKTTFQDEEFLRPAFSNGNILLNPQRFWINISLPDKKWIRPTESLKCQWIVAGDYFNRRPDKWSLMDNPSIDHIFQMRLPNCGLVSAIVGLVGYPDALKALFPRDGLSEHGVYEVRLCVFGEWKSVFVDDWFLSFRQHLVAIDSKNNQLWASIVEKAIAKEYGGYKKLNGFPANEAFLTLTGHPTTAFTTEDMSENEVWEILHNAHQSGFPISAASDRKDCAKMMKKGVPAKHVYSVIDVREWRGHRLVRLRSNWPVFRWTGKWSAGWCEENGCSEDLIHLNGRLGAISGSSWMEMKDFFQNYYLGGFSIRILQQSVSVTICRLRPSWTSVTVNTTVGGVIDNRNKAIRITVHEECKVCFSVMQPKYYQFYVAWRLKLDARYRGFLCIRRCEEGTGEVGRVIGCFHFDRLLASSSDDVLLEPGAYLVMLADCTLERSERNIVIHSSQPLAAQLVALNTTSLIESFQQHIRRFGETVSLSGQPPHPKAVIKKLWISKNCLMVMAENYTNDQHLQVRMYYKKDRGEFYSCRDEGKSLVHDKQVDVIPPMSRQIVFITYKFTLEFETSQPKIFVEYSLSSEKFATVWGKKTKHHPPIDSLMYMFHTLAIENK